MQNASAAELAVAADGLKKPRQAHGLLALVGRADLQPGSLTVQLDADVLAKQFVCRPEQINQVKLLIDAPFRMRRRGVELKLHLGEAPPETDRTLVQNIVKARLWLAMIIGGKTFPEIAEVEGVSKRRVQDVANLALLAPDILDGIAVGKQLEGLTTNYLIKTRFPAVWSEQRAQFSALQKPASQ